MHQIQRQDTEPYKPQPDWLAKHYQSSDIHKVTLFKPAKLPTLRHFSREGKSGAWESLCFQDGCRRTTCPSNERVDKRVAVLPMYSFILSKRC